MALAVGVIFAGTALPEEIFFRALIQNILMLRFGATTRTLLAASFIFGAAHLDNGPQPLPNWRYMIELPSPASLTAESSRSRQGVFHRDPASPGGLDQALFLLVPRRHRVSHKRTPPIPCLPSNP